MDFSMQSLLLTLLTLVASIFVLQEKKKKLVLGGTKSLPPGSFGWPLVGETYQFLFNKIEHFLQERVQKHSSEIFHTHILGESTVVLCGPGANKFVSTNETKLVKI